MYTRAYQIVSKVKFKKT
jgi:hypothetical protein